MVSNLHQKSKGQILVIVAVLLVGLLGMLALVLDGGNLYTQRRQAQLAADAGALAGARAYCLTESTTAAVTSAYDYAVNRNGANTANVIVNGELREVTVDTTITVETFFLHILGRSELTAPATATAVCTPPSSGRNVLPIAWSCRRPFGEWAGASDSEDCDMYWMDHEEWDNDGECIFGEDPIYVIMDSDKIDDDIICEDPQNPSTGGDGVAYVDCDIDDDGVNELEIIPGGYRSWLNLDGDTGNASELKDWIVDGYDDYLYPHTWLPGVSGNVTSAYKEVADNLLEEDVIVPVFNEFCDRVYGLPSAANLNCTWHPGEDTVVPTSSENDDYFHIISFSLFRIVCVDGGSDNCPAHEAAGLRELDPSLKTIEGCFVEGFDADFGSGGGVFDTGTLVVHLIH